MAQDENNRLSRAAGVDQRTGLPAFIAADLEASSKAEAATCELRDWVEILIDNDEGAPRAVAGRIYNHDKIKPGMWVVTEDVMWMVRDQATGKPTALVCQAYNYRLGEPLEVGTPPRHVMQRLEASIAERRDRRRERLAAGGPKPG